jgi:hypothetical protein
MDLSFLQGERLAAAMERFRLRLSPRSSNGALEVEDAREPGH